MFYKRLLQPLLVVVLLGLCLSLLACQPPSLTPQQSQQSQVLQQPQQTAEAQALQTVKLAFDAYDLAMTGLRDLQKRGVITEAKYQDIKNKYGWPAWNAIKAASTLAQQFATAKSDKATIKQNMDAAFTAMATAQEALKKIADAAKGGK